MRVVIALDKRIDPAAARALARLLFDPATEDAERADPGTPQPADSTRVSAK